ncbi:hypothetical protein NKG94_10170 [Micromonospora sp. M12]
MRGALTELVALPSGGDTSYPGLVWHDDLLWVSYYSSHEGGQTSTWPRSGWPAEPGRTARRPVSVPACHRR